MSDDEKPRDRKIAVIAVHGVGDQKPFDTVRAIGDLLQDLDVGAPAPDPEKPSPPCVEPGPVDPAYYPFREQTIRINVRPVVVPPGEDKLSVSGMRGPFHAFVNDEWRRQSPPAPSDEGESDDERLSERFMRGQLRCYRGEHPEDTYETIRLEGARAPQGGAAARDLHIYELYWADLSRLKAGLLSIFTELYQLLFHLSSLGTHAVDAEALRHRTSTWQWFRRAQSSAAVVLTVPIPIIHLLMLGVTAVVAGLNAFDRLGWPSTLVALTAIVAAGCVAAIGRWMWSRDVPLAIWLAPVGIWLATVGVAAWFALTHTATSTELLRLAASGVFIVVVTGLLALVLLAYDRRRPGTVWWGLALPPVLVLVGVASCVIKPPQTTDPLVFVWVRVFETLYGALLLSWPAFFLLGAASFAAGQLAVGGVRAGVGADLARRSRWTGMLMLALPALVLLITTLAGWGVLATGLIRWLNDIPYTPLIPWLHAKWLREVIDAFLGGPVGVALPILLLAAGLAALPAVWGLAPVVWAEVFPPGAVQALAPNRSERLGRWLTLALGALAVSGFVLYVAVTFVLPAIALTALAVQTQSHRWLSALGAGSGVVFTALFAARGRLRKLVLGFRSVLDILLDVDNWLREHPLDSNPKARICGRYVSLLRYIANWQTPGGDQYDALVIIAHSQGTVITADLLRFLRAQAGAQGMQAYDPQLARLDTLPISVFTMGCPLRQLYGLRFPRLYRWARHDNRQPMSPWQPRDLPLDQRPMPAGLGVGQWINAYRSGDYVGRHLWRTEPCDYKWTGDRSGSDVAAPVPLNSTDGAQRLEFCIGAGAHTHYWDRTGIIIARELDRLIAQA